MMYEAYHIDTNCARPLGTKRIEAIRIAHKHVAPVLPRLKYTGFNVWSRHDKHLARPRIRPREQWIWSPTPTHSAIVSKELFDQVERRTQKSVGTKEARAAYPTRRARRAGRLYVMRGRVRCALCGRRMEGTHQKGSNYYRCRVTATRGRATARDAPTPAPCRSRRTRSSRPCSSSWSGGCSEPSGSSTSAMSWTATGITRTTKS
ncbi:MAG: recombinase family protein [Solirubrobacterales bacterium]